MPTYYATGVNASLAVCDLQDTLSSNIRFNGGTKAQADATRLQRVFSLAENLPERPTGGSGVVQFIGIHEDMPLYMVEAGRNIAHSLEHDLDVGAQDTADQPSEETSNHQQPSSDDSPLTSLGATPTPTQQSFHESLLNLPPPAQPTAANIASLAQSQGLQDKVEAARQWLDTTTTKALLLDINLSDKSFLPEVRSDRARSALAFKDLKVEVFLNGQLIEVCMVHGEMRRSTLHAPKGTVRVSGRRIHRQVEKALIYSKESSQARRLADVDVAELRWNTVSLAHVWEAESRGCDHYRDLPPSAEFLKALAGLKLPPEMKGCTGLALIDVVITAGKGRKYGPETSYLMRPTRMDDPRYTSQQPADTKNVETVLLFPQLRHEETQEESKEPMVDLDTTTAQHTLLPLQTASTTPAKKTIDLTREFSPSLDLDKTILDTYTSSRGKVVKGRTLKQRLGDLKKMNESSMLEKLKELKTRFNGEDGQGVKKQKIASAHAAGEDDVLFEGAAALLDGTIDPAVLSKEAQTMQAGDADTSAVQNGTNAALNEGAGSDEKLLRTPKKVTKASALAKSPTTTPVKFKTPRRKQPDDVGSPHLKQEAAPKLEMDDSLLPPPKETKNRKSVGDSVAETIQAFEIPDCCKGSCVTYDEDAGAVRMAGKARGGEFSEESVLVGMRFIVV